jgi:uncharacterized protein
MAKKQIIKESVSGNVVRLGKKLEKYGIEIDKLIIFGSHARGTAHKNSDIDVCVVSSQFGRDYIDEMQFLFRQCRNISYDIEPIPASREDYENESTPLLSEIKKYGQEIAR